ncbi:MAG: glucokinase [Gemmatimonas sp.]
MPTHLIADLGATNSRFAIASPGGRPRHLRILHAAEFRTPLAAVRRYLSEIPDRDQPTSGALAVAAPIVGGRITFVNLGWSFSIEAMRRRLGFARLDVLNDLEAQAYAVAALTPGSCPRIGRGRPVRSAPVLVVGPGTGLGMACLLTASDGPHVIAGEAGHATLACADRRDARIIDSLWRRYGHTSAERALSGPGLAALYRAVGGSEQLEPAQVSARAKARSDRRAIAAADAFSRLLGGFCGDMALAFGALGGVYLVGGVIPRLGRAFNRRAFRVAFEAKGRYRDYLARVPVSLVDRNDLGVKGLAEYLVLQKTRRRRGA